MLSAGDRIGRFEIVALLGAGGMGEVYRARDMQIGREVAIKVLPPAFANDAARLQRFQDEARAAGVLNDPNILTVHEIGIDGGAPYIVSEVLEGDTLGDRLRSGAIPVRRSIDIATQIARGMAAAHEKGIVHRDLKPDNIFIRKDGRVKILDFGLAKLKPTPAEGLSTMETQERNTTPGTILGTAAYMSPEQVRGGTVDHRSDIFSLGCILHEMLSGSTPFARDSAVEMMNAILTADPPELAQSKANIPPALERIARHCLEKHPEARFQSASDIAFDLESVSGLSGAGAPSGQKPPRRWRALLWFAASVLAVAALAGAFVVGRRSAATSRTSFQRLTFQQGIVRNARFASDGETIVYSATWPPFHPQVFTTGSDSPASRALGFGDAHLLSISRSGRIALQLRPRTINNWVSAGTLAEVPLSGSAPRELMEDVEFADWDPDGKNLAIVRRVSGTARLEWPINKMVYQSGGWISHPRISSRGDAIAFVDHPVLRDDGGSVNLISRDGKRQVLADGFLTVQGLAWSAQGKKIWFTGTRTGSARALFSVSPGESERLIYAAPSCLTLHDVSREAALMTTENQRMTMIVSTAAGQKRDLTWLDFSSIRDFSPSGDTVLSVESGEGGGPEYATYARKIDGSPGVLLGPGRGMAFSPDGKWVLAIQRVGAAAGQLMLYPTGAGEARQVTRDTITRQWATFFPDGRRVAFIGSERGKGSRLYVQNLDGGVARPISPEGVRMDAHPVSPDGRFVAAIAPDGRLSLFPVEGGTTIPLPQDLTGMWPIRWSNDGRSLYMFRREEVPPRIYLYDVKSGRSTVAKTISLPEPGVGATAIQISPDGKLFGYSYATNLTDLQLVRGVQ